MKNRELKKHVSSIQCSGTLSLLQRKISNALLYNAYNKLLDDAEHQITIKQLCSLIGYNSHDQKTIRNALVHLISTVLEWNILDGFTGAEDWSASSILASARIKDGLCTYAYSPRMKSLLFTPTIYGRINLIVQARFKSNYGLALYENCARYKGVPTTRWFEIDIFRKLMGVSDDLYTIFRDFRRRVIDKAVDEVNTYSDIFIQSEIRRVGRKATGIRFHVKERERKNRIGCNSADFSAQEGANINSTNSKSKEVISALTLDFGLSMQEIETICKKYDLEFVHSKILLIQSSNGYKQGKIQNLAGYLREALEKNFQPAVSSAQLNRLKTKRADERQIQDKEEQAKQQCMKEKYTAYLDTAINKILTNLDKKLSDAMELGFKDFLLKPENTMIYTIFKKRGHDSKVVRGFYRQYLLGVYKEHFPIMMSLDDYVAQNT